MNAVHGDTDWTGYDKKKIDSDTKKSPYFTYASNDYGTYLANNILNGHEVIDITEYASDDYQSGTSDVLKEIVYQNPYIKTDSEGITYTARKNGDKTVLWVKYPKDYRARQKQLADFVKQASGSFQGSDRDKAVAIDRFLASRMTYDYDAYAAVDYGSANAFGSSKAIAAYPDAWSALGAVNGKGVCMSYAYAYQALAKAVGLDTRVVTGSVSGTKASHAWNYVKIDGTWLLIDPTWDDDGDTASDQYQLKNKTQVTDHHAYDDGWTLASQSGQY
nr:transglutaminase-like domain-containing protein [Bifidobacterium saguinibicoloris]